MAKNPISVGGLKQLINKTSGEVTEAAVKAAKRRGENFKARGHLLVRGNFGFDQQGNLGFVGNVVGGELVEAGGQADREWNSDGDGEMELEFTITVTRSDGLEELKE